MFYLVPEIHPVMGEYERRIKNEVDLSRIELEAARCKRAVLPLDYRPYKEPSSFLLLILSL